jgi:hypothetical protein
VAALAEAEKRGIQVFQFRLTTFIPEVLPFPFEEIDVVAWS